MNESFIHTTLEDLTQYITQNATSPELERWHLKVHQ